MNRSFARWAALAAATSALAFTSAAFAQATITLSDPNCSDFTLSGTAPNKTLTCVPVSPPPPGPPVCTSISGPSSGTINTPIALTANCSSSSGAITGYTWTGGNCAGSGATCNDPGTGIASGTQVQYTATATNGSGTSSPAVQKNVTWSTGGGGGGGGGGGAADCTAQGYAHTANIAENWASPVRMFTTSAGGFGPNDALVVRFTTGSGTAPGKVGIIRGAEYGTTPSGRHATLSTQACDFGSGLEVVGTQAGLGTNSPQLYFTVGGNSAGGIPALQPNTTYYMNVFNVSPASCAANGACDMFIELVKPSGL